MRVMLLFLFIHMRVTRLLGRSVSRNWKSWQRLWWVKSRLRTNHVEPRGQKPLNSRLCCNIHLFLHAVHPFSMYSKKKDIMINEIMKWKASLKSPPCLHPVFGPVFTPLSPLFQWYLQSKDILLNLKMKCWNSAFNAQGSRLIIVVVHVGAVKIYVAAVEALRKKEKTGWNSVYHQNWWKN
jgi:hypothetical protein